MGIRMLNHYIDSENKREVTTLTDQTTSEVEYRGMINVGIRGPDGMNTIPLPFDIKAESLEHAFEIYDVAGREAFEEFKKEQEEKMRQPKIVAPNGQTIDFRR